MKAKTFENLIRKVVREEIDYALRREIKSLKEDLRDELKPTITEHTERLVEVPKVPQSSLKALKIFNLTEKDIDFASIGDNTFLKQGNSINKINILFNKIEKKND